MKKLLPKPRSEDAVQSILRSFGASEGIFRATALTANIVMTTLVAQIAGFGADGVLVSASVHLGLAGILEIPTGLVADRFGPHHAVISGLCLKFITTAIFILATMAALDGNTSAAIIFLAFEAGFDALASSLLSGAYQASYLNWYKAHLTQQGIRHEDAPPLFLASFRHALRIRLGIPIAFILIMTATMLSAERTSFGIPTLLLPLIGLLTLRVITTTKIWTDLKSPLNRRTNERKSTTRSSPIGSLLLSIDVARHEGRSVFLLNLCASFLYLTAAMYLVGKSMQSLSQMGFDQIVSWAGGAGLGLIGHSIVILLGRFVYPRIARLGQSALMLCGYLIALSGAILGGVTLSDVPTSLLVITLVSTSVTTMLLAGGIQRWAESNVPDRVSESVATWFSLIETGALSLFGVTSAAILASDSLAFGLPFYAIVISLIGVSTAIIPAEKTSHPVTLRRFLTTRIVASASLICLTGIVFDARSTFSTLTNAAKDRERTYADMTLTNLREPLLQGAFVETKRRIDAMARDTGAICIWIIAEGFPVDPCSSQVVLDSHVSYAREMRFDSTSSSAFGIVHLTFDRSAIERAVRHKILANLLGYFGAALAAIWLLRLMSRRIVDEFAAVQRIASNPTDNVGLDLKFRLTEAEDIAKTLKEAVRAAMEAEKSEAILLTVQMLSHDVRKPFSMIQLVLDSLHRAKTYSETQGIVESSSGEIRAALASVSGMIEDVLEAGSDSAISADPVAVSTLLDATIREVCRVFPDCDVSFEYDLQHTESIAVDTLKVQRVFSNIVGNAIQAMDKKGHIWFRTRPVGEVIEFCIGNAGSFIPSEDLPHLFDAFFTKGKKGGTGLGLAIAKKVIEAHGGQIRCESSREIGVEFYLTLPTSGQLLDSHDSLPKTSSEVHDAFLSFSKTASEEMGEQEIIAGLENELMQRLDGKKLRVLILDDEAIYRNILASMLRRSDRLGSSIDIVLASSSTEALALLDTNVDAAIFDYDLGTGSLNGIETMIEAHKRAPSLKICLHSNRMPSTHKKLGLDAGALMFLPKPMGKAHLLGFLRDILPDVDNPSTLPADDCRTSAQPQRVSSPLVVPDQVNREAAQRSGGSEPNIAVLDDSLLFLKDWLRASPEKPMFVFDSPEAFWTYAKANHGFLDSLHGIITDNHFGMKSTTTGVEFAKSISGVPIFLCTAGYQRGKELPLGVAKVIPKAVLTWLEIQRMLRQYI